MKSEYKEPLLEEDSKEKFVDDFNIDFAHSVNNSKLIRKLHYEFEDDDDDEDEYSPPHLIDKRRIKIQHSSSM